jgi:hypothetical protein
MADAQKQPAAQPAAVASCAATDCAHNEDRNCTADSIQVAVTDGQAVCGTYTPEKPKARP